MRLGGEPNPNPHFYPAPDGSLTNAVIRATHYLAAEVPFLSI
jgi:hypothetical protein